MLRKLGLLATVVKIMKSLIIIMGSYINNVVDPYEQKAKYLESLDGQKVDDLIVLDPLSHTHRERQRPDKPISKPFKSNH